MPSVHKLILGTVQFGLNYGINNYNGKPKQDTVNVILKRAFDSHISTLDTAEVYGDAHRIIGSFHRNHPDKIFKVITKLPKVFNTTIQSKILGYLDELHVEKLEMIMFHSYASYVDHLDTLDVLLELKNRGIVGGIGVSVYDNYQIEKY